MSAGWSMSALERTANSSRTLRRGREAPAADILMEYVSNPSYRVAE